MKIAVVGIKDSWSTEYLVETVKRRNGSCLLVDMGHNDMTLTVRNNSCWYKGENLATFDAILIKKIGKEYKRELHDRLAIFMYLESLGVPCFSSAMSINSLLNRLSCTLILQANGLPIPPTSVTENPDEALLILEKYEKAVLKPLYTSKARGMLLLEYDSKKKDQLLNTLEEYQNKHTTLYIQKALNLNNGFDIGVVFVGGKYLTSYARYKAPEAWNTTTESGGNYAPYTAAPEIIELAYKAQKPFNLAFTCVDIALAPEPYVFEVSAFGGYKGITETSNINPAEILLDYVLKSINPDKA